MTSAKLRLHTFVPCVFSEWLMRIVPMSTYERLSSHRGLHMCIPPRRRCGGLPEREVVSFSIFLPDGARSLPPTQLQSSAAGSASQFLFSRPRQAGRKPGRLAGKAEKATDGWIERLSQRWSYLVSRLYNFETHLNV